VLFDSIKFCLPQISLIDADKHQAFKSALISDPDSYRDHGKWIHRSDILQRPPADFFQRILTGCSLILEKVFYICIVMNTRILMATPKPQSKKFAVDCFARDLV
jgi:hypothetical protein